MTTENNKIIAEFMGMKENSFTEAFKNVDNKFLFPSELVYHSDWNWLMEVVEKIRGIDQTAKEDFKIRLLHYQRNKKTVFDLSILEGKEYVYNACIEFIKWYNEQNKV